MAFEGFIEQGVTITISLGPMIDKDDGDTEKTGLTIEDTDIYLSKNGGAKANPSDTNNCSEDANGIYRKQLNGTDIDTTGRLTVYCHFTDCLYIRQNYIVLDPEAYAGFVGGTAFGTDDKILISTDAQNLSTTLDVNAEEISGSAPAAAAVESVFLGTGHTDNVDLAARKLKLDSDTDVALEILSSDDSAIKAVSSASGKHGMELAGNVAGSGLKATGGSGGAGIDAQGGSSSGAGIKAAAAANNDAGLELVKNGTGKDLDADETDAIGAAGAGLTDLGGMSTGMKEEVQTEAEEAIVAKHLDHLISVTGTIDDASPTSANFNTDLSEITTHHYDGMTIRFIDGVLARASRRIFIYTGSSYRNIAVYPHFSDAPANGDAFVILPTFTPTKNLILPIPLIPPAINLSDTATIRISVMFVDLLGTTIASSDITPGNIIIQRKAQGGTSWSTIVNEEDMTATTGGVYYNEVFDSGSGYARGDRLRIIIADQAIDQGDGYIYFPMPGSSFHFTNILEDASDALDTAIPGSPTADSINERIAALDDLISASKMAAQVKGMEADVITASALAADAVSEIRDAIMDKVVDGSIDVEEVLKILLAAKGGDMTKDGNTYVNKDQSGNAKITSVITANAVDRTLS